MTKLVVLAFASALLLAGCADPRPVAPTQVPAAMSLSPMEEMFHHSPMTYFPF